MMSERQKPSGAQFRADRPTEQDTVRTTIVGGRPPGSGQSLGPIPRGIEVLVKKASVDPEFRALLFERRAEAAADIGLKLDAAEVMMLRAVPDKQLDAIIKQTSVPKQHRRAFLGTAATTMLAALGVITAGCEMESPSGGSRPHDERPKKSITAGEGGCEPYMPDGAPELPDRPQDIPTTKGIRPDKPKDTRPTRPVMAEDGGCEPDMPDGAPELPDK
jgi:hypothetical protein